MNITHLPSRFPETFPCAAKLSLNKQDSWSLYLFKLVLIGSIVTPIFMVLYDLASLVIRSTCSGCKYVFTKHEKKPPTPLKGLQNQRAINKPSIEKELLSSRPRAGLLKTETNSAKNILPISNEDTSKVEQLRNNNHQLTT
ncbi:MAG: hypothetical protein AAGI90_04870, partial [Chlamydiota bacterium]